MKEVLEQQADYLKTISSRMLRLENKSLEIKNSLSNAVSVLTDISKSNLEVKDSVEKLASAPLVDKSTQLDEKEREAILRDNEQLKVLQEIRDNIAKSVPSIDKRDSDGVDLSALGGIGALGFGASSMIPSMGAGVFSNLAKMVEKAVMGSLLKFNIPLTKGRGELPTVPGATRAIPTGATIPATGTAEPAKKGGLLSRVSSATKSAGKGLLGAGKGLLGASGKALGGVARGVSSIPVLGSGFNVAMSLGSGVMDAVEEYKSSGNIAETIKKFAIGFVNEFTFGLIDKDTLGGLLDDASSKLTGIISSVVNTVSDTFEDISNYISDGVENMSASISDGWDNTIGSIQDTFGETINNISYSFQDFVTGIQDSIGDLISSVSSFFEDTIFSIVDFISKKFRTDSMDEMIAGRDEQLKKREEAKQETEKSRQERYEAREQERHQNAADLENRKTQRLVNQENRTAQRLSKRVERDKKLAEYRAIRDTGSTADNPLVPNTTYGATSGEEVKAIAAAASKDVAAGARANVDLESSIERSDIASTNAVPPPPIVPDRRPVYVAPPPPMPIPPAQKSLSSILDVSGLAPAERASRIEEAKARIVAETGDKRNAAKLDKMSDKQLMDFAKFQDGDAVQPTVIPKKQGIPEISNFNAVPAGLPKFEPAKDEAGNYLLPQDDPANAEFYSKSSVPTPGAAALVAPKPKNSELAMANPFYQPVSKDSSAVIATPKVASDNAKADRLSSASSAVANGNKQGATIINAPVTTNTSNSNQSVSSKQITSSNRGELPTLF